LQVAKHGRRVRLCSRRSHDWMKRLAILQRPCRPFPHSACWMPSFASPGADGAPNFFGLRWAMVRVHELAVFLLVLLHLAGADLRHVPLTDRRRRMERLLIGSGWVARNPSKPLTTVRSSSRWPNGIGSKAW